MIKLLITNLVFSWLVGAFFGDVIGFMKEDNK